MKNDSNLSRDELLAEVRELRARLKRLESPRESASEALAHGVFFQNVIESLVDPVYVVDARLSIRTVNSAFCEFVGLERHKLVGNDFKSIFPPAAAFVFTVNDETALGKGGCHIDMEMLADSTGTVRPYTTTRTVFSDPLSGTPELAVFLRDASDLMEARQALVESNHFMHAVLDAIPQPLNVRDKDGVYTFVNSSYESMMRKCKAEILGRTLGDLYPDKAQAQAMRERDLELSMKNGPDTMQYEDVFLYPDGVERDMVVTKAAIRDTAGAMTSSVVTMFDVTRLKRVERELASALEDMETIIENSLVGILFVRRRVIARVNQRLSEIMGYSRAELVGSKVEKLHLSREKFLEFGRRFYPYLSSKPIINEEYPLKRKDGTEIWCKVSGKPLDASDMSKGFIWIIDDITELKLAQEFREDVERMARHDLKTPLQGVIGYSTFMQEDESITEDQRWMLKEIEKAGDQMINLINLSLSLYKLESSTYELKRKPVDLVAIVRRIAGELQSRSEFQGITVSCALDGTPLADDDVFTVGGEELLLYSMMANLMKNAFEGSHENGRVQVGLERWNGARIAIHNAMPVPEEIRDVFFDKYVTSGKHNGSGLGTFSARLIAEAHGGAISMETSEEGGTTVVVLLPS